jgi:hypothetical protein
MEPFDQIETDEKNGVRFRCVCGHIIKKREDSFLPGAHMLSCAGCGNSSSEIRMLNGETVGIRTKDSAGRVG